MTITRRDFLAGTMAVAAVRPARHDISLAAKAVLERNLIKKDDKSI